MFLTQTSAGSLDPNQGWPESLAGMVTHILTTRKTRMNKWICPTIGVVLAVSLVTVIARFTIAGKTETAADGRVAVILTPGERDLVLTEMRGFLAGVQTMTVALNSKDMETVARTAESLGMKSAAEVPASLKGKLPLEFKQLGFSVHQAFDQIAADARTIGDPAHTQQQLGETLSRCVACHAGHQLTAR